MEKDVKLSCRSKDTSLVEKAKDEASAEFSENAGFDVKLSVSGDLSEGRFVAILLVNQPIMRILKKM